MGQVMHSRHSLSFQWRIHEIVSALINRSKDKIKGIGSAGPSCLPSNSLGVHLTLHFGIRHSPPKAYCTIWPCKKKKTKRDTSVWLEGEHDVWCFTPEAAARRGAVNGETVCVKSPAHLVLAHCAQTSWHPFHY